MRTKTLALSALLGTLGGASVMAQNIYSINAVGYINVICPPGFSMISCQLTCSPNNQIGNIMNDSNGVYDNVTIYKWNNSISQYEIDYGSSQFSSYANGWNDGGTITMNPGEAVWFDNANAPGNLGVTGLYITNTYVGTVPQGTNNVNLGAGFNMVSSPVPFGGDMVTNAGLTNVQPNDEIFVYQNLYPAASGYTTYSIDPFGGDAGYQGNWNPPGDPLVNVGYGFWYQNQNTPYVWTQVFTLTQ